ncbi:AMP-binding protein [Myxococcota bacterium]|nr:AMP-binding protein [Myxococcota bacterium]
MKTKHSQPLPIKTTPSTPSFELQNNETLDVEATFRGKNIVVVGGTGFLGKVWVSMLLHRYPDIGRLYLMVRARPHLSSEQRFWREIASSEVFRPLREKYQDKADAFLKAKILPIDGDVSKPRCGISQELQDELRSQAHVVVNVAGVVDFNPPIDEALHVNCFGVIHLIELCRTLGDLPLLHTSTCYVAGNRDGNIPEIDPRSFPFPYCEKIDPTHWDPEREIQEGHRLTDHAKREASEAYRESEFLTTAKENLNRKGEPCRGPALQDEFERIKKKFIEEMLSDEGGKRANHWGWTNTYTYSKSIGEQLLMQSGLRATIVRPSIVESCVEYPFPGWNEGINTSAPLIYIIVHGGATIFPGRWDVILDIIPNDMVCAGMIFALAALIANKHKPVYQLASGDTNPLIMNRSIELCSLYKHRMLRKKPLSSPLQQAIQSLYGSEGVSVDDFERYGVPAYSRWAKGLSKITREVGKIPGLGFLRGSAKQLEQASISLKKTAGIFKTFMPFIYDRRYRFETRNTRELYAMLTPQDRAKLPWTPEAIDWYNYFLDTHIPGLENWVRPLIEDKLRKTLKPLRAHADLVAMIDEVVDDNPYGVAFQKLVDGRLESVMYREFRASARRIAGMLQAEGITRGDRVLLAGANSPTWPIAYFGILYAGATAVPLDPDLGAERLHTLFQSSKARFAIWDQAFYRDAGHVLVGNGVQPDHPPVPFLLFEDIEQNKLPDHPYQDVTIDPEDIASLIFTSGTTGQPKGVMLTHTNFTKIRASLVPLFPLKHHDSALSLLPLHHTFEFTCGLLLPLSCGARITYLEELNGDNLITALKEAQVTALVGVPALWQLLAKRLRSRIKERGALLENLFDNLLQFNRSIGKMTGIDLGKTLFAPIHAQLGGHLRYLISGGAALPKETQELFNGLGLHLAEGYGLTEAAPVLTVAKGGPNEKLGHVGKPIPGVEVRIHDPNNEGIGEIIARGPNVMAGYADNPEATAAVLDQDGWLHTGDIGKFDHKGRLTIVGRSKEVIITSNGENVYPDDLEDMIGLPRSIKELVVLGISDERNTEKVAIMAVPAYGKEADDPSFTYEQALLKARTDLHDRFKKLPSHSRPSVIHFQPEALPRTASRKVKRKEVRALLEKMEAQHEIQGIETTGEISTQLIKTVARLAGISSEKIKAETRLAADLGLDSLMMGELHAELERMLDRRIKADELSSYETIDEIQRYLQRTAGEQISLHNSADVWLEEEAEDHDKNTTPPILPRVVQDTVKDVLRNVQESFYTSVMDTKVYGRANIPHNRPTLIAANHASHLDTGLVRTALGSYGDQLVTLGAQDYFFKDDLRRFYFENFTNVVPVDRKGGFDKSLEAARNVLREGKTLLIFPEGTRSKDGSIAAFKPGIGYLAQEFDLDILPIYLSGTYQSMPKGRAVPTKRKLRAYIGAPLDIEQLKALVQGREIPEASRILTHIIQTAIEHLRDKKRFDLAAYEIPKTKEKEDKPEDIVPALFAYLKDRFNQKEVEEPLCFYFTLGEDAQSKWSIEIGKQSCAIHPGKPSQGAADCVLKTSPEIFRQIVKESYVPDPDMFFSGQIKSNNPFLLQHFVRIFNL